MNYCIAAFAIILIISTIQWFVDGRENYKGPQIDIDAMRKGEALGMTGGPGDETNKEEAFRDEKPPQGEKPFLEQPE